MVRSGEATVCLSSSRLCSSVDLPDELLPSSMVTGASRTGPLSCQALMWRRWRWSIMGWFLSVFGLCRLSDKRE